MNSTLISLLCVVILIGLYYFWPYNYWKNRGVKTLRPNLLFGNLTGVFFRKIPVYRMFKEVYETCKKNGDICMGYYFFNIPTLVMVDPDLIKYVLIKDFSHFTDREFYFDENDPLTINLAALKGHKWRKSRDQLSPAFSPSKLKYSCQTLLKVSDQLKFVLNKSAENNEVVNLKDVVSKFMADAVGMNLFGIECNTLGNSNKEFLKVTQNIIGDSFFQHIILMLCELCPVVLHFFKIPLFNSEIQKFYLNLVKSTVEYREQNNVVRKDLLQSLIQIRNNIDLEDKANLNLNKKVEENDKSLNIEEVTAQILAFFAAAYETSTSTISFCVYDLASNEDVQNNLRKEIMSVLEKNGGKLDYDALMEMTYLDKCVSETLRKHAVVAMAARTCTKKYQLPKTDIVVDVGTILYLPIYELQNDPEYFPNPEKFDPERFSPEIKSMRPYSALLSFGDGPRNCIGLRLALLQVKIFIATFVGSYNFSINSKVKLPPTISKSNLIISFENPLYLNIEKI